MQKQLSNMELRAELDRYKNRQRDCYDNKLAHHFNVVDFQLEARLILKEVVELMEAIEKSDVDNIAEELSDIVIFCYGLAEMAQRDLDKSIFEKMAINAERIYKRNEDGTISKVNTKEGDSCDMRDKLSTREEEQVSKFISLLLRHKPWEVNLYIDEHGWADVKELCSKVGISTDALELIVKTDQKGRYEFNGAHTKIRACYGHSIQVDVNLSEQEPPDILYHGTSLKVVKKIEAEGIKPMSRQYVHLSTSFEQAVEVGKRHGSPAVFAVEAKKMFREQGGGYYYTSAGIWVTHKVPKEYVRRID